MEKVRPWCGQRSDRGRLKNRTERYACLFTPPPGRRAEYCAERVCLLACSLYARIGLPHHVSKLYQVFLHVTYDRVYRCKNSRQNSLW